MIDTKDFVAYTVGLCAMSVCVAKELSREDIEYYANIDQPTGISSRWSISPATTFRGGEPNPCLCNDHPEERLHYLLHC